MMYLDLRTAYFLAFLLVYLWVVGGLGWKGLYERDMDRTFTLPGTVILVLLWVPLTLWSGIRSTIDNLTDSDER